MHKVAYHYGTSLSIMAKSLSTPTNYTVTLYYFHTLLIVESSHNEFLAGRYVPTNEIASINSYADIKSHLEEPDLGFHRYLGLKQGEFGSSDSYLFPS